MKNEECSSFLNLSRWISSFFVLIFHLRNQFFSSFEYRYEHFFEMNLFHFLTNLGGPAVSVFFSISGLLIGERVLAQTLADSFNPKTYFIDRFTRIYIVLVPALLLTLLLDGLQLSFFKWARTPDISAQFTAANFFGNLLMLQSFAVKAFGSNGPLWSLSYEWLFYICFPLHCHLIFKRKLTFWNITLLIFTSVFFFYNHATFYFYAAWLTGILVRNRKCVAFLTPIRRLLIPLNIVLLIFLVPLFDKKPSLAYVLYSLNFSVLLSYILNPNLELWKAARLFLSKSARFNHQLAECSFSLYLIHCPIIYFLIPLTFGQRPLKNTVFDYLIFSFLACIVVIVAFVFSLLIEQKRYAVRNKLYAYFKLKPSKGPFLTCVPVAQNVD